MLIEIKNDLFDIANRIKSIDPKYFVVFNTKRQKYEVHYMRAKNTYELTVPFDKLDQRTVDFVLETKIENRRKILDEIEKNNQKIEQENQQKKYQNNMIFAEKVAGERYGS